MSCAEVELTILVELGSVLPLFGRDRVDRLVVGVELDRDELPEQRDDVATGKTPRSIWRQFAQFTPVKSIRIGFFSRAACSLACSRLMPQSTPWKLFSSRSACAGSVEVAFTSLIDSPPAPGDLDGCVERAGIGRKQADDEPVPDLALRRVAEQGGDQVQGQSQEGRTEDEATGADLDLIVIVIGPEDAQEIEAAHDREGDPARQDHGGIEPGVLRR